MASSDHVLDKLKRVLDHRHTWLTQHDRSLDHVMGDAERKEFLKWSKQLYHDQPRQQFLQQRDQKNGGSRKKTKGKKSRWMLHLRRTLGTHQMWYMVSFTGKYDASELEQMLDKQERVEDRGHSQAAADQQKSHQRELPKSRTQIVRKRFCEHLDNRVQRPNDRRPRFGRIENRDNNAKTNDLLMRVSSQ